MAKPHDPQAKARSKSTLADLEPGDSGWVHPGALRRAEDGSLLVDPSAPFRLTQLNLCHCRVERTVDGFEANLHECRDHEPEAASDADAHLEPARDATPDLPPPAADE